MPTYKRPLQDKDGNFIIPVTGVISDYSTSEVDTGCTWIDGSHIYKKTIYCGALPTTSAAKYTNHGISNLGMCVRIDGIAYNTTTGTTFPLSQTANNIDYTITLAIDHTQISLQCNTNRSAYDKVYVTIYYLKNS